MILLIDNYDSFSYNLYQLIGSINPDIKVVRNDQMMIDEIRALKPERIILSPGPGFPKDASASKRQRNWEKRFPSLASALVIRPSVKPLARQSPMRRSSCTASNPW